MSSEPNFEIEKHGNTYKISGIQIASGAPIDGQFLVYNEANNQWEYGAAIAGIPVQTGTPTDGQSLQYDATANEWKFA